METLAKRFSHILRGLLTYADYALFRLMRIGLPEKALGSPKRILIVERLLLGDIIVITPLLRALKRHFPEAKIDVLIQPSMKDVLSGNKEIENIILYSDQELKNNPKGVARELEGKYDLGVILNYGSYTISKILHDAKIPYRIGATKAGLLTGRGFFLTKKTKPTFAIKHKVEHHMDVVRTIGVDIEDKHLEVHIPAEAEVNVRKILKAGGINCSDQIIAIHVAPQHKTHRWYNDRFAKVADALIRKYGVKIVFTGIEKDAPLIVEIQKIMDFPSVSVAGKTSIKEYFALIKSARLLISVDTSAMHVGSAVGTPTIALFGAGNPTMWRPYGDRHMVIYKEREACTGCLRHSCNLRDMECMRAISVEDVLKAADDIIVRENILKAKQEV